VLEGLIAATGDLLAWPGPAIMLAGVLLGLIVGVLPGIGGAGAMALLIPVSFGMPQAQGIGFLMAVALSSGIGGQITSILISVPGDPPNAATTIDGYQMTKQGKAAEALGAATFGSIFGSIFGLVMFLAILPLARALVLSFSYPEFFMIALTGLIFVASFTGGAFMKGMIAVGLGLLISFIGLDPVNGNPRFTFGTLYLFDGVDIVPALVGLFAGAEMLALFSLRGSATIVETEVEGPPSRILDGLWSTIRAWRIVLASSALGFFGGTIPGIGGTLAAFLAYGQASRISKNRDQFGKGAVEGVIAPETANDADKGGNLLPTLAFGIPGGVIMAVLLAGLLIHGVPAGPNLLRGDLHIVYVIVVASFIPRLLAAAIVLAVGARALVITRIRGDVLAPLVAIVAIVGVYALRNEMLDVVAALIFSYIGYAMETHGFSRMGLIIALVLGSLIESSFIQTLATFGPAGFFTRPIALILFAIAMLTLLLPLARWIRGARRSSPRAGGRAA
jgi:putative tricarboxylic transport membrane protein